ncbi:MAG: protein kinase [Bacteroidota bacterium]
MIGQTISHYKILEKLGEGGMGVVYKAQDTKLDRFVALKFLSPHLASSEQDKSRFTQEAKAAAALNHPNICTIIDIQENDGVMFIVMEFVDGQTLREKKASITFKQAIDIGIQIAEGLGAAHDKGIVHRDIKPENIMIRRDGIAQIMDFGLAKLRGSVTRLTKEGSTIGTAGYMSPEQVQGQDIDHRSDIFSFGVLLYELITGQLPFKGVHETALMYEIVNMEAPPMSSIKPDIEATLDAIVLECLEKDPNERTQSAKQVSIDLKHFKRESTRQRVSRITTAKPVQSYSNVKQPEPQNIQLSKSTGLAGKIPWLISIVCLIGFSVFAGLYLKRQNIDPQMVQSYILPPENSSFATHSGNTGEGHLALSPDGSMLAFVCADSAGKTHLMVRPLNSIDAKELPSTQEAGYPFWSPDNRYIGFFQGGKLKKIEASGGPSLTICDAADGRGASWNQDGIIILAPNPAGPIYQVSEAGGTPVAITKFDTTRHTHSHRWPFFLPDGKHFLYFSRSSFGGVEREEDALYTASLDGKDNKRLIPAKANVAYVSGMLIYLSDKTLMAQRFQPDKLELIGEAKPIAEPIEYDLDYNRAIFTVSQNGILCYQSRSTKVGWQLEWLDRKGNLVGKIGEPAQIGSAALSPDEKKIAYDVYDPQSKNKDIWIYELARGIKTRFTFDPSVDELPNWSPDGSKIIFHSDRKGHYDLYQKTTDGEGSEDVLLESPEAKFPYDFSSDGKYFTYSANDSHTGSDIWILPLTGDRKPIRLVQSEFDDDVSHFSRDMRWISYRSNESGNYELYVRPFLDAEGKIATTQARKWQISVNGIAVNSSEEWSKNGKEFYYLSQDNKFIAVEVRTNGSSFEIGNSNELFDVKSNTAISFVDASADGNKFLFIVTVGGEVHPPITLVTNWDKELKNQ